VCVLTRKASTHSSCTLATAMTSAPPILWRPPPSTLPSTVATLAGMHEEGVALLMVVQWLLCLEGGIETSRRAPM
jgi:hypothetical protein